MLGWRRHIGTVPIECLSSGWIPDSTRFEVKRSSRSYYDESVSRIETDNHDLYCKKVCTLRSFRRSYWCR
jgi:hypothetical protein